MKRHLKIFVWIFCVLSPTFALYSEELKIQANNEEKSEQKFESLFLEALWEEALGQTLEPRRQALTLWRLGRINSLKELIKSKREFLLDYEIRLKLLAEGPQKALSYGKSLLESSSNPHLYIDVLAAAVLSGDKKEAADLFQKIPEITQLDASSLEQLCELQVTLGWMLADPKITRRAVIKLIDMGIQKYSWNPRFKTLRSAYYFRIGQKIDAKDWAQELKDERAQDPLFNLLPKDAGLTFANKEALEENINYLHRTAEKLLVGQETLAGVKNREKIGPMLKKLEGKAPNHPMTIVLRAAQKFLVTKNAVSPPAIEKVVSTSGLYWHLLSLLVAEPFDRRGALDYGREACRREPWNVNFHVIHATNCHREGLPEEALRHLTKAHNLEPRLSQVWNLKTLLESVKKDFSVYYEEPFHIRMRRDEWPAFRHLLLPELKNNYTVLKNKYKAAPSELHIQLFSDKQDFDVSVFMVPSAPAIGACMGRLITMPAPSYLQYRREPWASVLRHEMAHAFHVERSQGKVSRWFTEGLAHYEEVLANPIWDWEEGYDQKLLNLKASGELRVIGDLNDAFTGDDVRFYYQYCRWITEWIHQEKGWESLIKILDAYADGIPDQEIFKHVFNLDNYDAEREFQTWLEENVIKKIPYPAQVPGPLTEISGLANALKEGQHLTIIDQTDNSKVPVHLLYRALSLDEIGESDAAAVIFSKIKEKLKNNFHLNFYYGRNLAESGHLQESEFHLIKALDIYPQMVSSSGNPYTWLYQIYSESKQIEKAIEIVWKYTRIQQKDHRARFWLVRRLIEKCDYARIRTLLKEIQFIHPYHFEAILWDADQAKRENDLEAEKHSYERLFACAPMNDLVDQETLWSDQERLDFLVKGIIPWLSLLEGDNKQEAALTIEKYFPNHPFIKEILSVNEN